MEQNTRHWGSAVERFLVDESSSVCLTDAGQQGSKHGKGRNLHDVAVLGSEKSEREEKISIENSTMMGEVVDEKGDVSILLSSSTKVSV